jgi:hypothetical protein
MIKLILLLKNKILFKIKKNGLKEFDSYYIFIFIYTIYSLYYNHTKFITIRNYISNN